jgi:hypothetical protein
MARGLLSAAAVVALGLVVSGCAPGDAESIDDETAADQDAALSGANGGACIESEYNCKLRVSGGNRVSNAQENLWAVDDDVVLDGNGDLMGMNTRDHLEFNYGQTRRIGDVTYAFATSTSNASAGWVPIDAIVSEGTFRDRVGEVNAKAAGLGKMACYAVKNSHDDSRELLKVVYDSTATHERAGDYMPLVRKNGKRYANLTFNVPGFALGGVAIDIFPAGTKFRRLDVPTEHGKPSIDIPLWKKDGQGRYRAQAGTMKFVYGYVVSKTGTRRNGWMAYESLTQSSACP